MRYTSMVIHVAMLTAPAFTFAFDGENETDH